MQVVKCASADSARLSVSDELVNAFLLKGMLDPGAATLREPSAMNNQDPKRIG
jgi:hypothetical protein